MKSKLQRLLAVFTVSMTALLEPSVPLSRSLNSLHKSNENSADVQYISQEAIYWSISSVDSMPIKRSNNLAIKWLSIFFDSCGIRAQCKEMRCGLFPNSSVYHACVKPQHSPRQNPIINSEYLLAANTPATHKDLNISAHKLLSCMSCTI